MNLCEAVAAEVDTEDADPRLDPSLVRCHLGVDDLGAVALLGVVHDHPASVFRVAHLVEALPASTLVLELPPLSVPLFRQYARDDHVPPRLGGEMSVAIQHADGEGWRVVGADAPNREYVRQLVAALWRDNNLRPVARSIGRDLIRSVGHALACRVAAVVGSWTNLRPRLYHHLTHDVTLLDDPSTQAAHERSHAAQFRALVDAIEPPATTVLVDDLRESVMAERVTELRRDGDVVVVVGLGHLDALDERLRSTAEGLTDNV